MRARRASAPRAAPPMAADRSPLSILARPRVLVAVVMAASIGLSLWLLGPDGESPVAVAIAAGEGARGEAQPARLSEPVASEAESGRAASERSEVPPSATPAQDEEDEEDEGPSHLLRVLDAATRAPLAGIVVAPFERAGVRAQRTVTGEDGTARISTSCWQIRVLDPEARYLSQDVTPFLDEETIELVPAERALSLRVLDSRTSQPIAGVLAWVAKEREDAAALGIPPRWTDEEGFVLFARHATEGWPARQVEAQGGRLVVDLRAPGYSPRSLPLEELADDTGHVETFLQASAHLTIRVADPQEAGRGAMLLLGSQRKHAKFTTGVEDDTYDLPREPSGEVVIPDAPVRIPLRLALVHTGPGSDDEGQELAELLLEPGERRTVDVTLGDRVRVIVELVHPDGSPFEGEITLSERTDVRSYAELANEDRVHSRWSSDGEFVFEGVPAGRYRVFAHVAIADDSLGIVEAVGEEVTARFEVRRGVQLVLRWPKQVDLDGLQAKWDERMAELRRLHGDDFDGRPEYDELLDEARAAYQEAAVEIVKRTAGLRLAVWSHSLATWLVENAPVPSPFLGALPRIRLGPGSYDLVITEEESGVSRRFAFLVEEGDAESIFLDVECP